MTLRVTFWPGTAVSFYRRQTLSGSGGLRVLAFFDRPRLSPSAKRLSAPPPETETSRAGSSPVARIQAPAEFISAALFLRRQRPRGWKGRRTAYARRQVWRSRRAGFSRLSRARSKRALATVLRACLAVHVAWRSVSRQDAWPVRRGGPPRRTRDATAMGRIRGRRLVGRSLCRRRRWRRMRHNLGGH